MVSSGLGNLTMSMNEFTQASGNVLRESTADFKEPSKKSKAYNSKMISKTRVDIERAV